MSLVFRPASGCVPVVKAHMQMFVCVLNTCPSVIFIWNFLYQLTSALTPSTCPATSCYLYVNTVGTADCGSIQSSHSVNHVFMHAAHIFRLIIQLASCQIANHNLSLEWFLILLLWIVLCDCPAGGFSIFSLKLEVSHAAWDSGWIINVVSVMCWPSSSSGGGEGPPNSSQSHCNSLLERREDF